MAMTFDLTDRVNEAVTSLLARDPRDGSQLDGALWIGFVCHRDGQSVVVRRFHAAITDDGEVITSDSVRIAIRNAVIEAAGE